MKIKCKHCGKLFVPNTPQHKYCSSRCVARHNYTYEGKFRKYKNLSCPDWRCPNCGTKQKLLFDPTTPDNKFKFLNFRCRKCKQKVRELLVENS